MALHLSVPPQEDKPPIPAETRPRIVQGLVDGISYAHPITAAQTILEPLFLLNRQAVAADLRFKLMEIYRPALLNITQGLSAQCMGHALPLPEDALAAAATAKKLLTELAYGYKLAILDRLNRVFVIGGHKAMAVLVQRAIHALDQLLQMGYCTYAPAPDGVWSEIHRLYLLAARQGVYGTMVMDGLAKTSVTLTYMQALLVALADPNHLRPNDLLLVRDYLARYGELAELKPLGKPENPAGVFLVRLKSDHIPISFAKYQGPTDMRTDILLITVELARKVNEHLVGLQEGTPPAKLGLPDSAHQKHYQDLLAHLLKHWALAPKRAFARSVKNESINLCIGLDAVHYYLNGEQGYPGPKEEVHQEAASLNFVASPTKPKEVGEKAATRWLVVNESAGGMALSKFPAVRAKVQVGDLLGLRADGESGWRLGVVRRASSGETGELEIGVQMLAPAATTAWVRPDNEGKSDLALMLPELAALKQPATLVTRTGMYQPARLLEVVALPDNKTLRVLATRLIERTSSFERFQYSLV
ncbi:MAG: hypothetical protein N2Z69_02225 [Methylophilaceae bacterium]|nr:hypothetical protein [Methylophilaceae bacterium]